MERRLSVQQQQQQQQQQSHLTNGSYNRVNPNQQGLPPQQQPQMHSMQSTPNMQLPNSRYSKEMQGIIDKKQRKDRQFIRTHSKL